jgi:insulin-like growth factor 2 mRNA-binding protein 1
MINQSGAAIKVAQPKDDGIQDQSPSPSQTSASSGSPGGALPSERKVTIVGTPEAQWKAQLMLFRKVGFEGQTGPQDAHLTVEILVPSTQVGRIIGKSGQTVRELQRLTHATIKLPDESQNSADETPVQIKGDFLSTQAAQRQIRALVTRGLQAPASSGASQRGPGRRSHNSTSSTSITTIATAASANSPQLAPETPVSDKAESHKSDEEAREDQEENDNEDEATGSTSPDDTSTTT